MLLLSMPSSSREDDLEDELDVCMRSKLVARESIEADRNEPELVREGVPVRA